MDEKRVWGIHTLDDMLFLEKHVIAIGWEEMGDFPASLPPARRIRINTSRPFRGRKNSLSPTAWGCFIDLSTRRRSGIM